MIKNRYLYLTEEILIEAAINAIKEWGQPKSKSPTWSFAPLVVLTCPVPTFALPTNSVALSVVRFFA
ncbi:hypothetical protein CsSME_00006583 [Camellia sinensis var. sinensis]